MQHESGEQPAQPNDEADAQPNDVAAVQQVVSLFKLKGYFTIQNYLIKSGFTVVI